MRGEHSPEPGGERQETDRSGRTEPPAFPEEGIERLPELAATEVDPPLGESSSDSAELSGPDLMTGEPLEEHFRALSAQQDRDFASLLDIAEQRKQLEWSKWENMTEMLLAVNLFLSQNPVSYYGRTGDAPVEQVMRLERLLHQRERRLIKEVVRRWREAGLS